MKEPEIVDETQTLALEQTSVEAITRGEVDTQVATAKRFPRSLSKFKKDALTMATVDPETAASCHYRLVRGGNAIEGPSVRLAEIVATAWGNLRAESRILEEGARHITAQATAWDMETNLLVRIETRRRITTKTGKRYGDDMVQTAANAAASIAFRNAVFRVVPRAYVDPILEKCKQVGAGDKASLAANRQQWLQWLEARKIDRTRVLAELDVEGIEDIGLDEIAHLQGLVQGAKETGTPLDELFPQPEGIPTPKPGVHATKKARQSKPAAPPEPPPPEQEPEPARPPEAAQNGPQAQTEVTQDELPGIKGLNAHETELLKTVKKAQSLVEIDVLIKACNAERIRAKNRPKIADAIAARKAEIEAGNE